MNEIKTAGEGTSSRIIEEIAFQASMLALHDAIEAARNGEAGDLHRVAGAATGLNAELGMLVGQVRRPPSRGL